MHLTILSEKHNLVSETRFQVKSSLLIVKRQLQNLFTGAERFTDKGELVNAPVVAVSESGLWNPDDNEQNWILTAGKIQNLRLAAKQLHGIEVKGGSIFSFWKHIGNPNTLKGYVVGREIREGCIVPTIAGGLCQLSNALYDAALKANFEIVERHRHTRVIKGSLAEQDRDATVKWNYIDLRFKSNVSFRIEVDITADKLVVKFRSNGNNIPAVTEGNVVKQSSKLNDCYSCGNVSCFKHPDKKGPVRKGTVTAYLLDERWEEHEAYIKQQATESDYFILPAYKNRLVRTARYNWWVKEGSNILSVWPVAVKRALAMRVAAKTGANAFARSLQLDREVATAMAKLIPVQCTHVVVSQNLLPFLFEQGVLGGRTFDVLMNRLPMEKLHARLNEAHNVYPHSKTLNDFRAAGKFVELENMALTKAQKVISAHSEICDMFNNKVVRLSWSYPTAAGNYLKGEKLLFPAATVARKGAYEVRQLADDLKLPVVLGGAIVEEPDFWQGIETETGSANLFKDVAVLVYPAYVEHQPRLLLKALAMGIPVVTTTASGLSPAANLTIVPTGNYPAFKTAVTEVLSR